MEGVGVLHDELATAQQAEAGAHLVAELVLDLIERHRQRLVAAKLVAHQVGEGLLVGGTQAELAVVAVADTHELGTVGVPAARLVPQLGGGQDGELHLLGSDAVHLLAYDALDLEQRAPGKGQVRVEAGSGLADAAGAQQVPQARDIGLLRVLAQGGCIESRHPHIRGGGHWERSNLQGVLRRHTILLNTAKGCGLAFPSSQNATLSPQRARRLSGLRGPAPRSCPHGTRPPSPGRRPRRCRLRAPRRDR